VSSHLIICADGTWNHVVEKDPKTGAAVSTNVAKLATVLSPVAIKDKREWQQKIFYLEGVGTTEGESFEGGAFGFGLLENIQRAYEFIVRHYSPGDRIYLFGFSRGAFTARSLGGLLRTVGILRRDASAKIEDAMAIYSHPLFEAEPDLPRCQIFRQMHSHPKYDIECIGVWDTVGSLGIPSMAPKLQKFLDISWHFHNVGLGDHVKNAFHALAINERRSTFEPTLWRKKRGDTQNLVQRWFPGVHSDVGGGYAPKKDVGGKTMPVLSDIPLRWMIQMLNGDLANGHERVRGLNQETSLAFVPDWETRLGLGAADGQQVPNDSWEGLFKFLDKLRGKSLGYVRPFQTYGIDAELETCEDIDPSAKLCFKHEATREAVSKGKVTWHPSFEERFRD
jgi:hypothetical protein